MIMRGDLIETFELIYGLKKKISSQTGNLQSGQHSKTKYINQLGLSADRTGLFQKKIRRKRN